MKRRDFLRNSTLASTGLLVPQFLLDFKAKRLYRSRTGKILVVIQLSGGNDGLNTIVPYRNDRYYQERPSIALAAKDVLPVSDDLGFHPELAPLRDLYDNGLMSVVNNVGYPNPDRSHFRSTDIWHTASSSDEYWTTGWLGRYLDSNCPGTEHTYSALEIDGSVSLAMKGKQRTGFAFNDVRRLQQTSENRFLKAIGSHDHDHEENVAYLYKTMVNTQQTADYLLTQTRAHESRSNYPGNALGRNLRQIAKLITADTDTKVYYTSFGGFDTHAQQPTRQARLLRAYATAVRAFVDDLKRNNLLDDVLILTFSEFGRRVAQNAGNGTDHGTANNLFLMGGSLHKPGFFNQGPNLLDLENGDLKYQIDFRQIYATLLDEWLEADSKLVLREEFSKLALLA